MAEIDCLRIELGIAHCLFLKAWCDGPADADEGELWWRLARLCIVWEGRNA